MALTDISCITLKYLNRLKKLTCPRTRGGDPARAIRKRVEPPMRGVLSFFINMESMIALKEKITSRKELEKALSFIIVDDWLNYPYDANLTIEENVEKYEEHVRSLRMERLKLYYDICLDEEEDALDNSEHK